MQTNEALAKKSGDDKKLQMVASRKKKLEDRMGQEKNDKGHRFSRNKCALQLALKPLKHPGIYVYQRKPAMYAFFASLTALLPVLSVPDQLRLA